MSPFPSVPRDFLGPLRVEQEQRLIGNGDREAIVVGAGLCDGEDERAYIEYDPSSFCFISKPLISP